MAQKIFYSKIDNQGEAECLEFTTIDDVRSFINRIIYPLKLDTEKIFVVAIQGEVFVTENDFFVEEIFDGNLNSVYPFYEGEEIFIKECRTYEEAYEIALLLKKKMRCAN